MNSGFLSIEKPGNSCCVTAAAKMVKLAAIQVLVCVPKVKIKEL